MKIQIILRVGSSVFGVSAILLLLAPHNFLHLLGLASDESLTWAMRMIGITVFALAGNMFLNSYQSDIRKLKLIAIIMTGSAFGLAVLTVTIPAKLTWFSYLYTIIGLVFAFAYLAAILKLRDGAPRQD